MGIYFLEFILDYIKKMIGSENGPYQSNHDLSRIDKNSIINNKYIIILSDYYFFDRYYHLLYPMIT